MRRLFLLLSTFLLSAVVLTACGKPTVQTVNKSMQNWVLVDETSHMSFISIKKGDVAEVHSFTGLAGRVDSGGHAVVEIVLDTVETNIDIRNTRMREHLFETVLHPIATIIADVPMSDYQTMKSGDRRMIETTLQVNLHGIKSSIEGELMVTRVGVDKILIETRTPILVHADEFDLVEGLDILQELAKLPSITPIVPISFSLVFEAQN